MAEGGSLGRAEAYDATGARLARWDVNGDVQAVEQIGDLIFFGGHDFGPDEEENVGVVDPADLAPFDVDIFPAPPDSGDGVWAFHATAAELWLGGQSSSPYFGFARYAPTAPPRPRDDLVALDSDWAYLDDGSDQGSAWRQHGFDDSAWGTGAAQLGFGDGDESTTLQSGHVTYWLRRDFTIGDASSVTDLSLSLVIDDGAVAYLNGTEVARHNLPAGTIDSSTRASTTVFGPAESNFTNFDVPDGLLVDGTNTLAVEVHQVSPGSSDLSFEGRLTGVVGPSDTTPPSVPPGLAPAAVDPTSFTLAWDPATDDVGVDHYEVFVDGVPFGDASTTSLEIVGLSPSTTYQVTVEAVDLAGNRSGLSAALGVTTADAVATTTELIAAGSVWRYLDDGSEQGGGLAPTGLRRHRRGPAARPSWGSAMVTRPRSWPTAR